MLPNSISIKNKSVTLYLMQKEGECEMCKYSVANRENNL